MENRPISGIICEFNPLHNGHKKLLEFASNGGKTPVVCILSGNFVQRGDVALFDKWTRCRAALACGADLVVELPLSWAMSGAERFAYGGVSLAWAAGCTQLVFGSECGDTALLGKTAAYLNSPDFSHDLCTAPVEEQALPFAARRERTVARRLGDVAAQTIHTPNNILAVEYCKAIASLHTNMTPRTILRQGVAHDKPAQGNSASASALRAILLSENKGAAAAYMPRKAAEIFSSATMASIDRLEIAILCRLRTAKPEDFSKTPDVREGLENRILAAARQATSLQELYDAVKSKRYSHARIRRVILSFFLGIENQPQVPPYLRVLGMNATGALLLKNARLPVITRAAQLRTMNYMCQSVFHLESRADDLYALAQPIPGIAGSNEQHGMIVIR